MRCQELHRKMSLALDGRLPPGERRQLDAHLDSCPACAREWRSWQEIDRLFAGAPMMPPPEDLAERIMVRIRQRPERRALGPALITLALGLAALAGLGVYALLPALSSCLGLVMAAVEAPGGPALLWGLLARLLDIASVLAHAVRLLLWAAVKSRSAWIALAYAIAGILALQAWLRIVVFRRAPTPKV